MPTESKKSTGKTPKRAAPAPKKKSSSRRRKNKPSAAARLLPAALILIVVIAIIAGGLVLLSVWRDLSHSGSGTTTSSGSVIQREDVPQNSYTTENFVSETDGTVSYQDEAYVSIHGIDVSSHQGNIDWAALAQEDVEFAILRIGYRGYTAGGLNADEKFVENLSGAQQNGIQAGAYFYSQALSAEEAREEAEYVLELLNDAQLDLPVFFDWERHTAEDSRTNSTDSTILTDCALAFCQTIEAGGYQAGIYFYSSLALDIYDLGQLTGYTFWLSQPGEIPKFDYTFAMWQYSYEGSLSGIDGNVDLNLMFIPSSDGQTAETAQPTE